MLERKMLKELKQWAQAPAKKAFVLLGARQTGKTFIVRQFAQDAARDIVEINFLDDETAGSFLAASSGAQDFLSRLSLAVGRGIPEGALIFLDEVQHLGSQAVTLAKFIVEDGRYDIVLSGSFLGAELEGIRSFPVGYATVRDMRPLDFEEFCWACNVPQSIMDDISHCYAEKLPMEESLHHRMVELFRRYIVIGGMPEAVQAYLDGGLSLGAARSVCTEIIPQYRRDITKYAKERRLQILAIFDAMPAQLSKENKRFMMQAIKAGQTYERLKDDFDWICSSGTGLQARVVTEPRFPLSRTEVKEKFKLYSSDTGLLLAQYPPAFAMKVLDGARNVNFGAVYENVVAQELTAAGIPLRYFHSSRKGEIDFLVETAAGDVLPIEVKSGKDYKLHTALNSLLGTPEYGIECACVFSEANVSRGERAGKPVHYLPLYMVPCLAQERASAIDTLHLAPITF